MGVQALVSTMREAWVHGPGLVGAVEHLVKALVDDDGQALTTIGRVTTERGPSTGRELGKRLFEAVGGGHRACFSVPMTTLLIPRGIEGEQHLGSELSALFQYRGNRVGIGFGMGWQGFQNLGQFKQLVQNKLHVTQRRCVGGHGVFPGLWVDGLG